MYEMYMLFIFIVVKYYIFFISKPGSLKTMCVALLYITGFISSIRGTYISKYPFKYYVVCQYCMRMVVPSNEYIFIYIWHISVSIQIIKHVSTH